jgi:DNA-binding MarR family transcriptional regulator
MDLLLSALGHPVRLAIVEYLLGVDQEIRVRPREATQAELREHFRLTRGNLTKHMKRLMAANVIASSPGPRADQPIYCLRQTELLTILLKNAADLDAALAGEIATFHVMEAETKAAVAERLNSD